MKLKHAQPAQYVPLCPDEFIGPAHDIARIFAAKAKRLRDERDESLKYVLTGDPGIGTSNLKICDLHERFQSRLQQFAVKTPEPKLIGNLLARLGLNKSTITEILEGSGVNVRAALLDAQSILYAQAL